MTCEDPDVRLAIAIELLESLEWHADGTENRGDGPVQTYTCPACYAYSDEGHAHDCRLALFLGRPRMPKPPLA